MPWKSLQIKITNKDVESGFLEVESCVKVDSIFTIEKKMVAKVESGESWWGKDEIGWAVWGVSRGLFGKKKIKIEGKIAEEWFDLALEEEDPVMEQKIKAW